MPTRNFQFDQKELAEIIARHVNVEYFPNSKSNDWRYDVSFGSKLVGSEMYPSQEVTCTVTVVELKK